MSLRAHGDLVDKFSDHGECMLEVPPVCLKRHAR
jgi:hypothetical protein